MLIYYWSVRIWLIQARKLISRPFSNGLWSPCDASCHAHTSHVEPSAAEVPAFVLVSSRYRICSWPDAARWYCSSLTAKSVFISGMCTLVLSDKTRKYTGWCRETVKFEIIRKKWRKLNKTLFDPENVFYKSGNFIRHHFFKNYVI
jgi:hypothetical protein